MGMEELMDPVIAHEKECERIKNTEVTINGVKVLVKDMYPDDFGAKEFFEKINLITKGKTGKAPKVGKEDLEDTDPSSIEDDD